MKNETELTIQKKDIFANQKYFEAVLPKNFDVNKFMATLSLEVQKNPKLGKCSNLIEVAKDVASFGLIIGGLAQQSYLIPYSKKSKEGNTWTETMTAQLIIGYKGYVSKLEEAGYSIEVELVTKEELEKGFFQEIRGSNPQIIHNPIRNCVRTKENIALAYCILTKEGKQTFCVLSKEEIEQGEILYVTNAGETLNFKEVKVRQEGQYAKLNKPASLATKAPPPPTARRPHAYETVTLAGGKISQTEV